MKMKRIYLIRHGETKGNLEDKVQGDNDPISEIGERQAEKVAEFLKEKPPFRLFSSDFQRAFVTAEKIEEACQVNIETRTYLRELKRPSVFEEKESKNADYKNFLKAADENVTNKDWYFSDEENFFDLNKRVESFFEEIETVKEDLVVVSHARTIILIIMRFINQKEVTPEFWRDAMNSFKVENGSISTFSFEEKVDHWGYPHWRVESLLCTGHLRELLL